MSFFSIDFPSTLGMFYSWQRHAGHDPNFVLPMSSDYCHENRQHFIGRCPTTLSKFFGRHCTPSLNHSRTRNSLSLLDDHINRKVFMSYNTNTNQKPSWSSHPGSSSSSKDLGNGNPIASTSTVPKRRILRKISKEAQPTPRRMTSTSIAPPSPIHENSLSELRSTKSMDDIKPSNRPSQNTGKSGVAWPFNRQVPLDSKTANQPPLKEQSGSSSSAVASKIRMVGRGGSGSRLRQVSSNPPVLNLDVLSPRQPLDSGFYRPTGRGGLGSLSTKPLTKFKPPSAILRLLRGRRQPNESKPHEAPSPDIYAQPLSPNFHSGQIPNDSFTISNGSREYLDEILFPSAASTLGDLDDDDLDDNSYIEKATHSTPDVRHQRSQNKLARTLGELPWSLVEGRQSSNDSLKLTDSPTQDSRTFPRRASLGEDSIGPGPSDHKSDSSTPTDDLHQLNLGDLSRSWGELDNRSSFNSDSHSPILFAPSPFNDSSTSPTGEYNSTHSHSLSLPNDLTSDRNSLAVDRYNDLVPLGTHDEDTVISVAQAVPPESKSWTGEWNEDIQDVIQGLRQL